MNFELAGYYKITATDKDTREERVLADWFPNLITNNGMDLVNVADSDMHRYCYVGSGTNAPTVNDSSLQSQIAVIAGSGSNANQNLAQATPPYYGSIIRTWTFSPGAAVGNLSEVGCGKDAAGINLFSRSLIKDSAGLPITVTVLANDYLTVSYELRLYPPLTDSVSTVTIVGVETECTVRASLVTSTSYWGMYYNGAYSTVANIYSGNHSVYRGVLGAITSNPSLIIGSIGMSAGTGVYTNGDYFRDGVVNLSLIQGNHEDGISAILIPTWLGAFQIGLNPPIVKDNTRTLQLTYRVSWARKEIP